MASPLPAVYTESSSVNYLTASLPSIRSTVAWTRLPDGAVLFSPETEVYYAMNGVAALIWELLPRHSESVDALAAAVSERFTDVRLEQIRADVIELLADLERSGLVDPPEDGSGSD